MKQTAERPFVITYSAEYEERIEGLRAELAYYRDAYNELYKKEQFRDGLFAVSPETLTISHKVSIDALVRYLKEHERDRDAATGYIKADLYTCADIARQSYETLRGNLEEVSRELRIHDGQEIETDIGNVPIFDRLVVRVKTNDRKRYPQGYYLETYLKEREILFHPDQYKPQTPIEWGGKRKDAGRKKCKMCGAMMKAKDHVRTMQRQHICPNCHDEVWDEVTRVSADVPPTPNDNEPMNAPVEQPEPAKINLIFATPESLAAAEIEASNPPLEEVETPPLLPQVALCSTGTVDTCPPPRWLRHKKVWCPWRYEEPEKPRADGKLDKVPYQARGRSPQRARTNDHTTWMTYDQAQAIYEQSIREGWKRPFEGIGFMCDGSFVGIDLDHCRNKETGEIAAWAQAIIDRFPGAYVYVTPSREGVRLVIGGKKPGPRCKKGNIEIYEEVRFFTWTPEQLAGIPDELVDGQASLDALYTEVWPEAAEPPNSPTLGNFTCSGSDQEILDRARNAKNGAKFIALYDHGDTSGYASQSEADQALCEMLLYWADGDASTLERLFPHSGLMREKWERADYRERTIKRALGLSRRKWVAA